MAKQYMAKQCECEYWVGKFDYDEGVYSIHRSGNMLRYSVQRPVPSRKLMASKGLLKHLAFPIFSLRAKLKKR